MWIPEKESYDWGLASGNSGQRGGRECILKDLSFHPRLTVVLGEKEADAQKTIGQKSEPDLIHLLLLPGGVSSSTELYRHVGSGVSKQHGYRPRALRHLLPGPALCPSAAQVLGQPAVQSRLHHLRLVERIRRQCDAI